MWLVETLTPRIAEIVGQIAIESQIEEFPGESGIILLHIAIQPCAFPVHAGFYPEIKQFFINIGIIISVNDIGRRRQCQSKKEWSRD